MSEKVDAPTSSTDVSLNEKSSGHAKAVIKNVDMSEEMQQEAVDVASAALEKYNIEKDIAAQIKKEFDRRHGPTWHVVVGKNFGSYVTHGTSSSSLSSCQYRARAADTRLPATPLPRIAAACLLLTRGLQKQSTSSTSTSARSHTSSGSPKKKHHSPFLSKRSLYDW